jgi:hypothetical protein
MQREVIASKALLDAFKKKKILIRPFQLPNTPIKTKRDI